MTNPSVKPVGRHSKVEKKSVPAKVHKASVADDEQPLAVKTEKKLSYLYAVGRRKTAIARVRLYPKENKNELVVNSKDYRKYFPYFEWQAIVEQPLKKLDLLGKYYITVKVLGGGPRAQAEALRHGLSRVLLKFDETFKKTLRGEGWLTRDPREKERKKPGLKRARRAPQWQKR